MTTNLHTERLLLREFAHDDARPVHAIVGDDRVTAWLSFDSRDLAGATDMVEGAIQRAGQSPRGEFYLAVIKKGSHDLIGFARLGLNGVRAAKLGYAIHADEWGQGYASEAVGAAVKFGLEELGLHRISAAIGPDNLSSIKVAERAGFRYEGRIRDHVFTNAAWRDSLLYGLLASDTLPVPLTGDDGRKAVPPVASA